MYAACSWALASEVWAQLELAHAKMSAEVRKLGTTEVHHGTPRQEEGSCAAHDLAAGLRCAHGRAARHCMGAGAGGRRNT
mmetsp:Transcript_51975/g.134806  ORF Transcript_51975/g.134806 Transcript_51975/m.134806 type:complete len:80 (+) Transcript_51975:663-902(+)